VLFHLRIELQPFRELLYQVDITKYTICDRILLKPLRAQSVLISSISTRCRSIVLALVLFVCSLLSGDLVRAQERTLDSTVNAPAALETLQDTSENELEFIDTGFENASPLWYETVAKGLVEVHLLYDHERSQPNRAAGHFHFLLNAKTGTKLTIEFKNLQNVYNGRPGSVANELKAAVVSENGRDWRAVPLDGRVDNRVQLSVEMPGPRLFVARVEPYRISDLDRLLDSIRTHPSVSIQTIGQTAEGRDLEIVRVGNPSAKRRVFLRARAHPWEAGGNWVVEGLINRLLKEDDQANAFRKNYCVWILPMANKDGVARGKTRFNTNGIDLNRNWSLPADRVLSPENYALENWLDAMVKENKRPHLAIELHNDGRGLLHISLPSAGESNRYLKRMEIFESMLRKHSWFTEGNKKETIRNVGTLSDGLLERYGIDSLVHELNCNWIAGLQDFPSGKHWETYGGQLAVVLNEYFASAE